MLAGRHPFQGETPFAVMDQHRSAPVPDLRELCGVPSDLAHLVERLLEKQPEDRPEDGELVLKLKAFCGDGG
jgi:serine/threonine protein kinase